GAARDSAHDGIPAPYGMWRRRECRRRAGCRRHTGTSAPPEPVPRGVRQTGMRSAAAAAVAVAGTVLFMISACGGGAAPGGNGAAPGGETPADHTTGPPPSDRAGAPGTDRGMDATPPPRPDPDDDPATPL